MGDDENTTHADIVKNRILKFMDEDRPAYDLLTRTFLEIHEKEKSKTRCMHIQLGSSQQLDHGDHGGHCSPVVDDTNAAVLFCIQQHKSHKGCYCVYFLNGRVTVSENGQRGVVYDSEDLVDIPATFSIVGQQLDEYGIRETEESYTIFPALEKKYVLTDVIADKFVMMYDNKPFYSIVMKPTPNISTQIMDHNLMYVSIYKNQHG